MTEQDLLIMIKKCEDLLIEMDHIREGSWLNLHNYIAKKYKLVEERDAIAKATSEAQWKSIARIRQLEGKLHSERAFTQWGSASQIK